MCLPFKISTFASLTANKSEFSFTLSASIIIKHKKTLWQFAQQSLNLIPISRDYVKKINQVGLNGMIGVKKRPIAEATKNQIAVIIFFINQQPEVHVNLYDTFTFFK